MFDPLILIRLRVNQICVHMKDWFHLYPAKNNWNSPRQSRPPKFVKYMTANYKITPSRDVTEEQIFRVFQANNVLIIFGKNWKNPFPLLRMPSINPQ